MKRRGTSKRPPKWDELGPYTIALNEEVFLAAHACAKGPYQRAIIVGWEATNLSTLRPDLAAIYRPTYEASVHTLLHRMADNNIPYVYNCYLHDKCILVIGVDAPQEEAEIKALASCLREHDQKRVVRVEERKELRMVNRAERAKRGAEKANTVIPSVRDVFSELDELLRSKG